MIISNNFELFFQVPYKIYPKETLFFGPLKDDLKRFLDINENPLFKSGDGEIEYFVYVDQGGRPLGRITAHIHHKSNNLHKWTRGFFGFFECIDDINIAKALLDKACTWLKEKGMTEIYGNFNLTAMQMCGVTTDHFDNFAYADQVYSPPHIAKLLEELGFSKTFPMTTFEIDLVKEDPNTTVNEKVKELINNPDFEFDHVRKKHMKEHMLAVLDLLNKGFAFNPMFVPLTEDEFFFQAKDMTLIIDEKITVFAKHKGRPVGTIVCIPDIAEMLYKSKSKMNIRAIYEFIKIKLAPKRATLIIASNYPEYHAIGLGRAMIHILGKNLKARGYKKLGITWVSDENPAPLLLVKQFNPKPLHRLHLFKKDL